MGSTSPPTCIQPHPRSKRNRHICKQAHAESGQSGDCSRRGDKVSLDTGYTDHIVCIALAEVRTVSRTDTSAASLRNDSRIDRNDVGHGEECCQSGTNFGEKVRALPLPTMTGAIKAEVSADKGASNARIGVVNPLGDTHDDGNLRKKTDPESEERDDAVLGRGGLI